MRKDYTIELPDGFVVDTEKSTDTKIVVKAVEQKTKCKTYEEIQRYNIMNGKMQYYINGLGHIMSFKLNDGIMLHSTLNHVPTREIAEKIIALCQLYIIAEYYNDGWVPDWNNNSERKFFASYFPVDDTFNPTGTWYYMQGGPYFKSEEAIKEAYKHNKEIFKKALSV